MKKRYYVVGALLVAAAVCVVYARREVQQSKWVARGHRHNDEQTYSLVFDGDPIITLNRKSGADLRMQAPDIDGKHNLWLDDASGNPVARLKLDGYWIRGTIGGKEVALRPGAVVDLEEYID